MRSWQHDETGRTTSAAESPGPRWAEVGDAPDPQLCKFYGVGTYPELVAAMLHHIEKLQAKLPAAPSFAPQRVREG